VVAEMQFMCSTGLASASGQDFLSDLSGNLAKLTSGKPPLISSYVSSAVRQQNQEVGGGLLVQGALGMYPCVEASIVNIDSLSTGLQKGTREKAGTIVGKNKLDDKELLKIDIKDALVEFLLDPATGDARLTAKRIGEHLKAYADSHPVQHHSNVAQTTLTDAAREAIQETGAAPNLLTAVTNALAQSNVTSRFSELDKGVKAATQEMAKL
jgi:hypothetical protein